MFCLLTCLFISFAFAVISATETPRQHKGVRATCLLRLTYQWHDLTWQFVHVGRAMLVL
jgi:hypothetical protein